MTDCWAWSDVTSEILWADGVSCIGLVTAGAGVSPSALTDGPRGHNRRVNDRDWWELYGRPRAIRQPREKFDRFAPALLTQDEERRAAEQAKRTNAIEAMLAELEQRMRR